MASDQNREDLTGLPSGIREQFEDLLTKYRKLAEQSEDLRMSMTEMEENARLDTLTGAIGYSAFLDELRRAADLMARHSIPVTVVVIELIHVDSLAQVYGEDIPLQALTGMKQVVEKRVRSSDVIGRTGKHELSIIMWYAEKFDSERRAGDLKRAVESQTLIEGKPHVSVRAAVGTAAATVNLSAEDMLQQARARAAQDRQRAA